MKAEASIVTSKYFSSLRKLLIDIETLVLSNFPEPDKQDKFQWREKELVEEFLENAVTQLIVLACKAEMCNVILLGEKKHKEKLVNQFYKLVNPSQLDYHRSNLIKLEDLYYIDGFISTRCYKQQQAICCDWPQVINFVHNKIQA